MSSALEARALAGVTVKKSEFSPASASFVMYLLLLTLPLWASASTLTTAALPPQLLPRSVRIDHRYVDSHADLVIDTQRPAFDWQLDEELQLNSAAPLRNVAQTAYRLVVTRHTPNASAELAHWDSGRVSSSRSVHVLYEGPAFASDATYGYALMYWSSSGAASGWAVGHFRTALLGVDGSEWRGQWIGSDAINMNQLRRAFTLPSDAVRATVFYSGVGYSELWLDGAKVDPSRVLDPGWTQYYRRCLYASFDLTPRLTAGEHALGVVLGDGWYSRQPQLLSDGDTPLLPLNVTYGPPRVILQLNAQLRTAATGLCGRTSSGRAARGPQWRPACIRAPCAI